MNSSDIGLKEFCNRVNPENQQVQFSPATSAHLTTCRGEDYDVEVIGYRRNGFKTFISWLIIVLTLGILRLVFHWCPNWMLVCTHSTCHLRKAHVVLIIETYQKKKKSFYVKRIEVLSSRDVVPLSDSRYQNAERAEKLPIYYDDGCFKEFESVRLLNFKRERFIWDDESQLFLAICGLDITDEMENVKNNPQGLSSNHQRLRSIVYGINEINVPLQSIGTLILLEILNPIYFFQVFSLTVWFFESYYYYTIAIIIMSIYGISSNVIQTYRNQRNLHSTVHSVDRAEVMRPDAKTEHIPTTQLVPGDVLVIPSHGCVMQCDAVLLRGTCIVNESMLTGESVPVTKTSLVNTYKDLDKNEKAHHTLFCGTQVIQTRYYGGEMVLAVVTNTSFMTAKGELVRSILYPPPVDFKFDSDLFKFIGFLAFVASFGLVYTIILKALKGASVTDIIIKALDIVTITVPPALPAAMTVARLNAQTRLQKDKIFCINSQEINVAGTINCVCFDKTGTLTEDGLDMWGVLPVEGGQFSDPCHNVEELKQSSTLPLAMAACQSLTLINNEIMGDPLDLKMFEFSKWQFEEPEIDDASKYDNIVPTVVKSPSEDVDQKEVGILQVFQFSSSLQRMSVITRILGHKEFIVVCKGSPEKISSLSIPETVPSNFHAHLKNYSKEGYRIIAIGWKILTDISYTAVQRLPREEVEKNLIFGGLIVMENRLKPESAGNIAILHRANVKMVMVTGDNILTAVSVARECGLIAEGEHVIDVQATEATVDHPAKIYFSSQDEQKSIVAIGETRLRPYVFAMNGATWSIIRESFPELIPRLIVRGTVFARMSPEQKQQLVGHLQELGYFVAMCGDGANDCGALKAANVGISLSDAEASVAASFTYKEANIACVPMVIKEGRGAIVTSFGVFKFMAAYSLTQFVSVMILYTIDSNLTDFQFLYIDIFLSLAFVGFFGNTMAYKGPIAPEPPITNLISAIPMLSLVFQLGLNILLQIIIFLFIQQQPWFKPHAPNNSSDYGCFENYAVFTASLYQYIQMSIVYSKGPPYRERIWTNYWLTSSILLLTAVCIYITVWPADWMVKLLELVMPPELNFRLYVIALGAFGFLLSVIVEELFIETMLTRKLRSAKRINGDTIYHSVKKEMDEDKKWPTLSAKVELVEPHTVDADTKPHIQMTVLRETNN
ncbi:polyamine-transporting ATPase 13A3-like isoform X2 [Neocloeon triangulifer]|uniref:polyamine-transporting ATPase 13A3-like isoform X2 n=1 Tax=Neocloeon triangulifer TaxID=2078957 RepID=UPI00286F001C|nr:polyamine-transporting ATPase 13A3-like isoform X2 [Neocloeon triangulifer]